MVVEQKRLVFLGDSLSRLRDFPVAARKEAAVQLHKVQLGLEPNGLEGHDCGRRRRARDPRPR